MIQSIGEFRVGVSFNPSNDTQVARIKEKAADLINLIDRLTVVDGEGVRCKELAMSEIESAAMWGVKAATKPAFDKRPGGPAS